MLPDDADTLRQGADQACRWLLGTTRWCSPDPRPDSKPGSQAPIWGRPRLPVSRHSRPFHPCWSLPKAAMDGSKEAGLPLVVAGKARDNRIPPTCPRLPEPGSAAKPQSRRTSLADRNPAGSVCEPQPRRESVSGAEAPETHGWLAFFELGGFAPQAPRDCCLLFARRAIRA